MAIVTAPLIAVKDGTGRDQYLFQGTELPEYVNAADVKRLVSLGLVENEKKPAAKSSDGDSSKAADAK